jgi:azurin
MRSFVSLLALPLALACGCKDNHAHADENAAPTAAPTPSPEAPAVTAPAPAPTPSASASANATTIEIAIASVGDTMAFDQTKLSVPTGARVHLTLTNKGTIAAMTHNWVLVRPKTEAAVAAAGLAKGPSGGYLDVTPDVLASTSLAPPKGTVDVTFTAPAPGKYPYICTFPGHYVMMKGELTVTP